MWIQHGFHHEFVDRRGRLARVSSIMLHEEIFSDIGFVSEHFDIEDSETIVSLCYDHDEKMYLILDRWERDSWLDEHKPLLLAEFARRIKIEKLADVAARMFS